MTAEPHWAEGPFALVPTPPYAAEQPDFFEKAASEMALVHNMILRGLNSIHKQAPWVKPEDTQDFLEYCKLWILVITTHHAGEERSLFPYIENATGVAGVMDVNKAQHETFHEGIEAMEVYLKGAMESNSFDGEKLIEIIDGFGSALRQHLVEEIATLVALRQYGSKLSDLQAVLDQDGKDNMAGAGFTTGLVMALLLHDKSWDGGKWANFPPAPAIMLFVVRKMLFHVHSNWWRFAPCDNNALPKEQYARPPQP